MKKLLKIWDRVEEFVVFISFLIALVLNFANVVTRFVIPSISLGFTEEFSLFMFVWTVLFGASICFREKSHLGLPLLYDAIKNIPAKIILLTFSNLCCLVAIVIMIRETGVMCLNQIEHGIVSTSAQMPAVIGTIAFPIGGVLIIGRIVQSYIDSVLQLIRSKKEVEVDE